MNHAVIVRAKARQRAQEQDLPRVTGAARKAKRQKSKRRPRR